MLVIALRDEADGEKDLKTRPLVLLLFANVFSGLLSEERGRYQVRLKGEGIPQA